jgi:hypothetical protein
MILLFEHERRGLATSFKMCAHDPAPTTPLPDNHLRCHLGVECRKCEFLEAIESAPNMPIRGNGRGEGLDLCRAHPAVIEA